MNTQTRSVSPIQTNTSRFLLALTLGTWLLAGSVSIWFWLSPYNDLSGLEWLGSPLLGMGALAILMTAYYLGARNLALRPTTHVVVWLLFLCLATVVNMLTLARYVFGEWKDFQTIPVVVAFELVLIALGVQFSIKEKSRGLMFLLLTWTVVLFLIVVTSMGTLGMALQPGFWTIGLMAELGLGILMGTLVIGASAIQDRQGALSSVLASVAWRVCVLIIGGLLAARFLLSAQYSIWLVSYVALAAILAVLVAALRTFLGVSTVAMRPGTRKEA
ncbi:MAG TPA: hypothetical protein VFI11_14810 [Anaerolineales bacterium]|nr:hypothetical protein [Anaerolineales bacterium]